MALKKAVLTSYTIKILPGITPNTYVTGTNIISNQEICMTTNVTLSRTLRKLNRILLSQVYKPYLQQQEQITFLIRNNVYDKQEHDENPPSSL